MPVTYKFIAVDKHKKTELYHSKELVDNSINYEQVKNFFIDTGYNITESDLINIKFIINNSQNMSLNEDENYLIDDNETKTIFVFTVDKETRTKLLELFNEKGRISENKKVTINSEKPSEEIIKPIPEEDIKITNEIIEESNNKTIELFKNNDFKTLLKIYKNNPDVFKTFSSYVSSGDAVINSFDDIDSNINNYNNEFEQIKNLDLSLSDESIKKSLIKHKGHLNLSLRYLLYIISEDDDAKQHID